MDREPNKSELRAKLFELLKTLSFRRGRVTLASGRQSDFYFDTKPTMLDAVGAGLLAELILQELKDVKADCVGGIELGAVPMIGPVVMKSPDYGRHLTGFVVRKAVKDHGTKKLIEGSSIQGKDVVILEDVTTSGGSALLAVKAARQAGGNVTLVLSILDRGEGAGALYAAEHVPFRSLFKASEFLAA